MTDDARCLPAAGKGLRQNITSLGPKVLPVSELLVFAANHIARKLLGFRQLKPYTPDFTNAVQHICIHTGACKHEDVAAVLHANARAAHVLAHAG